MPLSETNIANGYAPAQNHEKANQAHDVVGVTITIPASGAPITIGRAILDAVQHATTGVPELSIRSEEEVLASITQIRFVSVALDSEICYKAVDDSFVAFKTLFAGDTLDEVPAVRLWRRYIQSTAGATTGLVEVYYAG